MLISIITVTYNSAETLERTIKSVFSQTFKDIEYCIIDGGSTEATLDIIGKYAKEYPEHIKWISEKDRGIYDAMNKGVKLCTGDVIGILNSDDFFTSDDVLQHIADTFTRHPASEAVYGDVHFVSPDNLEKSIRYYSGYLFRPALTRFGFIAPHPSFYIRKEIFEKYGHYNTTFKISGDFDLITRFCTIHHIKTQYINLDMVTMRTGGASTQNLKARIDGARETLTACRNMGIYTNFIMISFKYILKVISAIPFKK